MQINHLKNLSKLIRYFILASTTQAGSGHPSSSLSAVELMTTLLFGGIFRFDSKKPLYANNDRLIFSKGHAAPLLYALWLAAGEVKEKELLRLRKFGSPLEGHPSMAFPYTEAATGSLGQGLSIGVGMALSAKYLDKLPYKTYVLLGDSEMSEGSQWEAMQIASHYKLDNLIGIIDVNRLGQTGETMYAHNLLSYQKRISAFGWEVIVIKDGHSIPQIMASYKKALKVKGKPVMIIAKTIKGKGVSFLENKEGWHGKALSQEQFESALKDLGRVDLSVRGEILKPNSIRTKNTRIKRKKQKQFINYKKGELVPTRKAYGEALVRIFPKFPEIVALDAEVSNSTYSEIFKKEYPERFFEMYIAEQNMVGAALGLSRQYSGANIKFVGSHGGVSVGEDGPSQMGLEDIAMFRSILRSVVLYPSDAVACEKLVEEAARFKGIVYIRTTRKGTPVIYNSKEKFPIGGCKVLRKSKRDVATVVAAGITLFEVLRAYEALKKEGIFIRVIDLYSIKPLDKITLQKAALSTKAIITVEDHFPFGGIGEAVKDALSESKVRVYSLAVGKIPRSGKPEELLDYEEISEKFIISKVKKIIKKHE